MTAHYAKVIDGIVVGVIRADAEFIENHADKSEGQWVQTSYNTRGGKHYDPVTGQEDTSPEKPALRANYAGIGHTYDAVNDVFYGPRPVDMYNQLCNSWTVSGPDWLWKPPIPKPTDAPVGKGYGWDEATQTWISIDHTKPL